MDTRDSKIELARIILSIENEELIQRLIEVIKKEKDDFWNDLSPSEQKEIKQGILQLENGKRVPYDEVLSKISKWKFISPPWPKKGY